MAVCKGTINLNGLELSVIEEQSQRVLTTGQLSQGLGTISQRITENFNRNRTRFIQGVHYFYLEGEDLVCLKHNLANSDLVGRNARGLYLWTERGAACHSKILDTDEAWDLYEILEKNYFESPGSVFDVLEKQLAVLRQHEQSFQEYRLTLGALSSAFKELEKRQSVLEEIQATWFARLNSPEDVKPIGFNEYARQTVTKIAHATDRLYREIWNEFYNKVARDANIRISTRITFMKKRAKREGLPQARINAINGLTVINSDPIFIATAKNVLRSMLKKYDLE